MLLLFLGRTVLSINPQLKSRMNYLNKYWIDCRDTFPAVHPLQNLWLSLYDSFVVNDQDQLSFSKERQKERKKLDLGCKYCLDMIDEEADIIMAKIMIELDVTKEKNNK